MKKSCLAILLVIIALSGNARVFGVDEEMDAELSEILEIEKVIVSEKEHEN